MEERRARRKARREARSSPYSHPSSTSSSAWASETTTTVVASKAPSNGALSESTATAGIDVDDKDDASSLRDFNTGTVVA